MLETKSGRLIVTKGMMIVNTMTMMFCAEGDSVLVMEEGIDR